MRFDGRSFCAALMVVAAQGCSSTSGVPYAMPASTSGPDDSGGASGGGAAQDAAMCDGSLPTMGSGTGAACTACRMKNCVSETAVCAADCACYPIDTCLETTLNYNFAECPNAISAGTGGNPALTKLVQCLDTNCLAPCFMSDGGAGGGDSASREQ